MISLVYHPAFDPYGSVLRIHRYLLMRGKAAYKEQIRLFDFLILFPEIMANRRMSNELRSQWRRLDFSKRFDYEIRPDPSGLFERMEPIFEAAFQTLAARDILISEDKSSNVWSLNIERVPQKVAEIAKRRNEEEADLIQFLSALDGAFPFFGPNGLKDRSGLLEFRYDTV